MSLFRTQPLDRIRAYASADGDGGRLARRLGAFDLTMLGIGAIIGVGIFVLTGTAAATRAGPAIMLSFALGGLGCALAACAYAELASVVPVAGSAYTYAYATLGELPAWIIGWDLVLEYAVGAIAVSIGWSGHLVELLASFGLPIPERLVHGTLDGGLFNLPAVLLVIALTLLQVRGVKESARVAGAVVLVKVAVVLLFLILGAPHVQASNWRPFLPFGSWGVVAGAGVVFFAYIGFDALTTASEETLRPQRDLPIALFASLGACTVLYMAVAAVLTGMVPFRELNHPAPVAMALVRSGVTWGGRAVALGVVFGLASVVLVMMMGQPRIFFAMSRDGLLSPWIAAVHPRYRTPHRATLVTGAVVALAAGTLPFQAVAQMTSIGTLFAFVLVCLGVIVLRRRRPDLPRAFRAPWVPVVPALGALLCFLMMLGLDGWTWVRFVSWMAIGLVVYATYGRRHASRAQVVLPTPAASVAPSGLDSSTRA